MSDDNWFKRKFDWLDVIANDPTLRGLPFAIAFKLAWRYLHSEKRYAWPSVDTLAAELNAKPRGVQRALDRMVDAGVLGVKKGGRGPRDTNHYEIRDDAVSRVQAALKKGVVEDTRKKGVLEDQKGCLGRSKNERGLSLGPRFSFCW
jgi:DNA-binding transcriptional regulator YhcF (GntR family)